MRPSRLFLVVLLAGGTCGHAVADEGRADESLPNTSPLVWQDDIASRIVDGADRFLLRQLELSIERRMKAWPGDPSSPQNYTQSLQPYRERLRYILGMQDERVPFEGLEILQTTERSGVVGRGQGFSATAVRWPVLGQVHGEGLLLTSGNRSAPYVVALPDADQTPEMIAGLQPGLPPAMQYARRLAENGCTVLIPTLISRELQPRNKRALLSNREYIYRSAYELGRHVIGYEIQKILAGVDWMEREIGDGPVCVGVMGWGEGGMLALYAGAVDTRIDAVCVSGYFESRQKIWQQPLDRNVFGLLESFGDAELAAMIAPRKLVIEACRSPEVELPGKGGAPAALTTPDIDVVRAEVRRIGQLCPYPVELVEVADGRGECGSDLALEKFLSHLGHLELVPDSGKPPESSTEEIADAAERQRRQVAELDRHNQWLLSESPYVRRDFMSKLDTTSLDAFESSVEWYRDYFRTEVVGHFDGEPLPFNARARVAYDKDAWTGYEVVLDVLPDVIAYGILLVPKGIAPNERRPVVVCQHGLEGRPQDLVDGDHRAYHDFAANLAEQGFVTFAPQNLYIFKDRFRSLQRKAYPLKKTIFSIIVPQHQQIVDWLQTLPFVDGRRIAFYGLSYGGKSAMRIPPLVDDYSLSICSGDFNEWVWKNASTRCRYSYVWTGEYEIFEYDLGSTFNYSEMAALIAPRPFMVERGHFDGVSSDEAVAYEFAKVRNLYNAQLGIGDRCEIEWFVGPHTINGQGTFDFLRKHLHWNARRDE